jgi:hypothetical protein
MPPIRIHCNRGKSEARIKPHFFSSSHLLRSHYGSGGLALQNGNEKRQPETAIETATRSGKKHENSE